MRMFSLSVRLFVNMMSGHTLLKLMGIGIYLLCFKLSMLVPPITIVGIILLISIIFFLILLEIFIAFLQAYLFVSLMMYYLTSIMYIEGMP